MLIYYIYLLIFIIKWHQNFAELENIIENPEWENTDFVPECQTGQVAECLQDAEQKEEKIWQ